MSVLAAPPLADTATPAAEPPARPCAATIGFDAALAIVRAQTRTLGIERVPLARAGRRILAEAVTSRVNSPRRDVAAMDGYAVRSQDLQLGGGLLRVAGASFAGDGVPAPLGMACAHEVATGGPVPAGADRVIPRELVKVLPGAIVVGAAPFKRHIRHRASDFAVGQELLAPGTRIGPRALAVAAAADLAEVGVWRRPRVAVLTTGNELACAGHASRSPDAMPDSLSEALLLMARQWGARPAGSRLLADDPGALAAALGEALADSDVVVIAGGASHGQRDHARRALLALGGTIAFAGVAMRPGKPVWLGTCGGKRVLGLPGNPTAALTTARLFLAPLVAAMAGSAFDAALGWFELPALADVATGGERHAFLLAARHAAGAKVLAVQDASAQWGLAAADLLVERRAGAAPAGAGAVLRCLAF